MTLTTQIKRVKLITQLLGILVSKTNPIMALNINKPKPIIKGARKIKYSNLNMDSY